MQGRYFKQNNAKRWEPKAPERWKNKIVAYMQWIIPLGEFYFYSLFYKITTPATLVNMDEIKWK